MKSFLLESISEETTHTSENTAILLRDVMKEYYAANMKKAIKICLKL